MPLILGIDPGLASLGWAALDLGRHSETVVDAGVIRTAKEAAKRRVLASDDNLRRIRELAEALEALIETHAPVAIAAESQSWPRSASASAKVGMAWGALGALTASFELPLVQCSPQALKRALTGRRDASKDDVMGALEARYGREALTPILALPKTLREHPSDALAAAVACLDAEVVRLCRRMGAA